MLPEFIGSTTPASPFTWASTCLLSNRATLTPTANGAATLNITAASPNTTAPAGCTDMYLVATIDWMDIVTVTAPGSQAFTVPVDHTTWVAREGVRVFRFIHDPLTTISDALATLSLFVPALTEATLDPASQAANLKFLKDYVGLTYENRSVDLTPNFDWSIVNSFDPLIISRLDGLVRVARHASS